MTFLTVHGDKAVTVYVLYDMKLSLIRAVAEVIEFNFSQLKLRTRGGIKRLIKPVLITGNVRKS